LIEAVSVKLKKIVNKKRLAKKEVRVCIAGKAELLIFPNHNDAQFHLMIAVNVTC
jgi:undecaprenyl pyrophosphate synthase